MYKCVVFSNPLTLSQPIRVMINMPVITIKVVILPHDSRLRFFFLTGLIWSCHLTTQYTYT